MTGPLEGIHIVELASIGPGPFCGMMLADHGAEVIRVNRIDDRGGPADALLRSRKSIAVDIKKPEGAALVRALSANADGLIEGFRPGVMERLGLGPDVLLGDNSNLVYGRMTGWGQTGPLADAAGHDINYIALSGVLHTCGRAGEKPTPPVNYVGDFGGGGMMLAFGMVSALLAVKNGGPGQVIDCAMTDGSAVLSAMTWGFLASGLWKDQRGVNIIDTGADFYDTYETSDGKWISIGSIEPQFYVQLREKLDLAGDTDFDEQLNPTLWRDRKRKLTEIFKTKTRDAWCEIFERSDACFAPVLSMGEAPSHPHNLARGTFVNVDGVTQPAPAPRYSKTQTTPPSSPPKPDADTEAILQSLGRSASDIDDLRNNGIVR